MNDVQFGSDVGAVLTPLKVDYQTFSDTVGMIYDCALDASLWTAALERAAGFFGAKTGSVTVVNPSTQDVRLVVDWGCDPMMMNEVRAKFATIMPFLTAFTQGELDKPFNSAMIVNLIDPEIRADLMRRCVFQSIAEPLGLGDSVTATIWREPSRFATFSFSVPNTRGEVSEEEMQFFSLIVPHVKRAVMIGDLLELKSVQSTALQHLIDTLGHAALVLRADGHIITLNRRAQALLDNRQIIRPNGGKLETADELAGEALTRTIARAEQDEAAMGHAGIGIPLSRAPAPAIAYVLPLARREAMRGFHHAASCIVLIKVAEASTPLAADALVSMFGLTPGESKAALAVHTADTLEDAAQALGITTLTLRTHLGRVYQKTNTHNQRQLSLLIERLTPPL